MNKLFVILLLVVCSSATAFQVYENYDGTMPELQENINSLPDGYDGIMYEFTAPDKESVDGHTLLTAISLYPANVNIGIYRSFTSPGVMYVSLVQADDVNRFVRLGLLDRMFANDKDHRVRVYITNANLWIETKAMNVGYDLGYEYVTPVAWAGSVKNSLNLHDEISSYGMLNVKSYAFYAGELKNTVNTYYSYPASSAWVGGSEKIRWLLASGITAGF